MIPSLMLILKQCTKNEHTRIASFDSLRAVEYNNISYEKELNE